MYVITVEFSDSSIKTFETSILNKAMLIVEGMIERSDVQDVSIEKH